VFYPEPVDAPPDPCPLTELAGLYGPAEDASINRRRTGVLVPLGQGLNWSGVATTPGTRPIWSGPARWRGSFALERWNAIWPAQEVSARSSR